MSPIIFQPPFLIESSLLQSYKSTFFIGLNYKMSVLSPSSREAMTAVATLLAQSRTAWPILIWPSGFQPKMIATMEARKPTTVAWTCGMNNRVAFTHQTFLSLKIPLQTQKVNICSLIMSHSHYDCPRRKTSSRGYFTLSNFGLFSGKKNPTLFIHLIISKSLCMVYIEICKQGSPFLKGSVPELVRGPLWSFSTSPWLCPSVRY